MKKRKIPSLEQIRRSYRWKRFFRQLSPLYWYRRWQKQDHRPKRSGSAWLKFAICRDGDLYLVECPECHTQHVYYSERNKRFVCTRCGVYFTVCTEDGVVKLYDHRNDDVRTPARAVYDLGAKVYRLGIAEDAPWWWEKKEVCRDLRDGRDAHGHAPYQIVGRDGDPAPETAVAKER